MFLVHVYQKIATMCQKKTFQRWDRLANERQNRGSKDEEEDLPEKTTGINKQEQVQEKSQLDSEDAESEN